jgi:hypothetical protein
MRVFSAFGICGPAFSITSRVAMFWRHCPPDYCRTTRPRVCISAASAQWLFWGSEHMYTLPNIGTGLRIVAQCPLHHLNGPSRMLCALHVALGTWHAVLQPVPRHWYGRARRESAIPAWPSRPLGKSIPVRRSLRGSVKMGSRARKVFEVVAQISHGFTASA